MKLRLRIIVFGFFLAFLIAFQFCEKKSLPSVTTSSVSDVTYVNAISGGVVTNNGGAEVTSRGICWNTTENPTITSEKTADGVGNGTFKSTLTGLAASTTYFIRAYATNSEGTSYGEQLRFTTLIKPPEADFSANPTSITAGGSVQFTDLSANSPSGWTWNFGDGSSGTEKNPLHVYPAEGNYTVTLTVTNVSGSSTRKKDNYIAVAPAVIIPLADFIFSKDKIKTGETVQFTDKSSNAPTGWKWSFGDDSTSTLQNPLHKYSASGIFTVSLVATNSAGSNTKTIANCISVDPQVPDAAFTASITVVPVGQSIQFTDQSANSPSAWTWDFGDGSSSALRNPTHVYANSGNYTVSLTVTNVSGSDTETKTNYISAGLPPNAQFTVSQANPKVDQAVRFTDQSTGNPLKWSWDFGDKLTSQVQNPDHAYSAMGKYTVSLTVTNAFGSDTETKSDYLDVMPLPPVADFIAEPTSIFEGEKIQFTDKSLNNPIEWGWNFDDASEDTSRNPLHGYGNTGIYSPSLSVANRSGSDTRKKTNYIIVSRRIEAETADTIKTGTIDSNDPGFTGTGFVNLDNRQGTYAVWKINLRGGRYTVEVRYANGSSERIMDVYVNNVLRINNLAFPPTGSWSTWSSVTFPLDLSTADNYLKLVGDNPNSGPSLDRFILTPVVRK